MVPLTAIVTSLTRPIHLTMADIAQEIQCADRSGAEAKAARRQRDETDPSMEWIYLRDSQQRWVARRVPRAGDGVLPKPSKGERILDGALELLGDVFTSWQPPRIVVPTATSPTASGRAKITL